MEQDEEKRGRTASLPWMTTGRRGGKKAVCYYRHSAQDKQENSIEIQQEQVRKFAADHDIEIVREFADRGISGLSVEGRDGFNEMLNDYVVACKEDFGYVLVLDVSRWGRFQETDQSAYYTGLCANYGKQVVFTTIGFPKENDLLHGLHLSIERYRAASYSRELSGKVFKGCAKIASGGYWAGGAPPYGTSRLLLDEQRKPLYVLKRGDHKAIHNQRVVLTLGEEREVETVRGIFDAFANEGKEPIEIAARLNEARVPSPGGGEWSKLSVLSVIGNPIYAGDMVWNKSSQKMKSRSRKNPRSEWILHPDAFAPIVPRETFTLAQEILQARSEARFRRRSEDDMLDRLRRLYDRYGLVRAKLIAATSEMVSPATYINRFHAMDLAYQALFRDVIARRASEVVECLRATGGVELVDDFMVVDETFSVLVEAAVPVSSGYEVYWSFHPHLRREIDLTIGVPLSMPDECTVLAYVALPRLLFRRRVRLSSSAPEEFALYTCRLPELISELRR